MTVLLIKVTVALSVSLASVRLARRSRAAVRHALLASGLAIALVLPMVSIMSPMVAVPLPITVPVEAIDISAIPLFENIANRGVTAAFPGAGPTAAGERRLSLGALLMSAWVAGTTIFMLPVLAGLWEMQRIRRGARRAPQLEDLARLMAGRVGVNRPITVLMHGGVAGPMTCGVLRPAIVLPAEAPDWPDGDVDRALVHELEHVRRADWVTHCVARIVCALYWFHPLVWIAWRELVFEAERACDDAVVIRADAEPYADQLLSLAQRLSDARRYPQLAMASSRDLSRRVLAVLNEAQPRGRAGRRCLTIIVAGAVSVLAVLAPIQGRGQTPGDEPLVGLWDMQPTAAGDSIVLRVCYAELFSRTEFAVEQVNWWPPPSTTVQQIRFALTRDAGTFAFEGTVADHVATGQFTFEVSSRFEAALHQRALPSLTPSQYLALAQHDIGLAAIDAQASQGMSDAVPLRLIRTAQARAQLEEIRAQVQDRIAKSSPGGASSPGAC
jgi:beta-lactamase regulating signal transducer with metallopeptidase domain